MSLRESVSYFSRSARWTTLMAVMVLCFIGMNGSSRLRPIWQLLDAGMSAKHVADDLRVVVVGIDSYRESGFRVDESRLQEAAATNNVPLINYPAVWFGLAYIPGVTLKNILLLAGVLYVLFGATLVVLFRNESNRVQLCAFLALLSPAILLLCERANNDLLIFCFVSWAALLAARSKRRSEVGAVLLLLGASFLKLFPIAAAFALLEGGFRRKKVLFAVCLGIFLLGALGLRADILRVRKTTPEPTHNAYGAKVMVYELLGKVTVRRQAIRLEQWWSRLEARGDHARLITVCGVGAQFLALILCTGCGLLGMRSRHAVEVTRVLAPRQSVLFLAGASIYAATFIANNNWSYRLVFLLLCIPALAGLAEARIRKPGGWLFGPLLCILLLVCWITPIYEPLEYFVVHNLLHWAAAGGLCFVSGSILRVAVDVAARGLPQLEGEAILPPPRDSL